MLDSYIPSDQSVKIRYKLMQACADPLNAPMDFCVHLQEGLLKGVLFYRNARTIYGGFMTTIYNMVGGTYQGMQGTIFTEPQSEEYCIQNYRLASRIPINHPDVSLDIKKILKLRVNADTNACLEYHLREALHPSNIKYISKEEFYQAMVHEIRFYWTPQNISHPIYAYYNETARIIEDQIQSNTNISFASAGKESYLNILTRFHNQLVLTNGTTFNMAENSDILLGGLASEPTRLKLAERMFASINNATIFSPMQALVITARTDNNDAINIAESFAQGKKPPTLKSIYYTFESLEETDLTILRSLVETHQLYARNALQYLTYLKDFKRERQFLSHLSQTTSSLHYFKNNLTALETCNPYNATSIVSSVATGLFGHLLNENMLSCKELIKQIAHPGFHLHNFLSEDYHSLAHQLEDTSLFDEKMMKVVLFIMMLMTLALALGVAKVAYKPLSKCTARLFCENKNATSANDSTPRAFEERMFIKKTRTTKIITTKTTFWKKTRAATDNATPGLVPTVRKKISSLFI